MRTPIISLLLAAGLFTGSALADTVKLADSAPDRYVVVKGDTLWGISGKFLKEPWRWPEIWHLNKAQIKDPHWIYPGDVVVLDRSGKEPRLSLLKNQKLSTTGSGVDKLSPKVRESALGDGATPSIPITAIEPFLTKPLIMELADFMAAPRIAAGPDNRVVYATGDQIYSVGMKNAQPGQTWQVFRKGKELKDPDDPKRVLGMEVNYLGDVRVKDVGDVDTLEVVSAKEEIAPGDRMILSPEKQFINYVPHLPPSEIKGKVISTYGGVAEAGPLTTIVLNRGALDGLDVGTVLFSYKAGRKLAKEDSNEPDLVTPPLKSGNVFIYRVFPSLSYGLVLDSTLPVNVGDEVRAVAESQ